MFKIEKLVNVLESSGIEVERVYGSQDYSSGVLYLKSGQQIRLDKTPDNYKVPKIVQDFTTFMKMRGRVTMKNIVTDFYKEIYTPRFHRNRVYTLIHRTRKHHKVLSHGKGVYSLEISDEKETLY